LCTTGRWGRTCPSRRCATSPDEPSGLLPGGQPGLHRRGLRGLWVHGDQLRLHGGGGQLPRDHTGPHRAPIGEVDDFGSFVSASLGYIALPFYGLAPLTGSITELFEPQGAWGAFRTSAFWVLVNSLYWIFWINIMVGMTNVLPAVPWTAGTSSATARCVGAKGQKGRERTGAHAVRGNDHQRPQHIRPLPRSYGSSSARGWDDHSRQTKEIIATPLLM